MQRWDVAFLSFFVSIGRPSHPAKAGFDCGAPQVPMLEPGKLRSFPCPLRSIRLRWRKTGMENGIGFPRCAPG